MPADCISYRFCPRTDCGCNYRLTVRLLNGDKEEVDKWEFNDTKEEGQDWAKVFAFTTLWANLADDN